MYGIVQRLRRVDGSVASEFRDEIVRWNAVFLRVKDLPEDEMKLAIQVAAEGRPQRFLRGDSVFAALTALYDGPRMEFGDNHDLALHVIDAFTPPTLGEDDESRSIKAAKALYGIGVVDLAAWREESSEG